MAEASGETRAAAAGTRALRHARSPVRLRMTMFTVLVGTAAPLLDSALMHVALRSVAGGLRMPLTTAHWVVTAYLLAFAAAVPTSTWAVQRFGAERVYAAALAVFAAASAMSGAACCPGQLILARAVQGAAGGLIGAVGRAMLAAAAGPARLPRVMAVYEVPVILVVVTGPLLGGELLAHQGWRAVFFVNVPVGLLAAVLALRLSRSRPAGPARRLDTLGLLLISPGLAGVTYGVSAAGQSGSVASAAVLVPLGAGTALVAAFAAWSLRGRSALLDLRLHRDPVFRAAAQSTLAIGAAVLGGAVLLPLYLQTVRGADVWRTGLLIAPQGLGAAVATALSGRLYERVGGAVVLAGTGILLAATLPFAFLTAQTPYHWLVVCALVRGAGIGLAITPAMTAGFQALGPARTSEASTQLQMLQHVGASLGTAVLVLVLTRVSAAGPRPGSPSAARPFDAAYWALSAISAVCLMPAAALVRNRRPR